MPSEQSGPTEPAVAAGRAGMPSWLVPVLLAIVALVMISALVQPGRVLLGGVLLRLRLPGRRGRRRQGHVEHLGRDDQRTAGRRPGLHDDRPPGGTRRSRLPHAGQRRRGQLRVPHAELLHDDDPPAAAVPAHHRLLRVDEPQGAGPDGRDHVDRPVQGEDLQHRAPRHPLRRCCRLRGSQTRDRRGRGLPEGARTVPGDRCEDPKGRPAGRASGNGQDADRPRRRR